MASSKAKGSQLAWYMIFLPLLLSTSFLVINNFVPGLIDLPKVPSSFYHSLSNLLSLSSSLSSLSTLTSNSTTIPSYDANELSANELSYRMVIDAGSTGSRLFVYSLQTDPSTTAADDNTPLITRIGTRKTTPGLSSFLDAPPGAAAKSFMKLFDHALSIIPESSHKTTSIEIVATAGMRLLSDSDQTSIYDALYLGLSNHYSDVLPTLSRSSISTLSGNLEGFYGLLSANYHAGIISDQLVVKDGKEDEFLGALDMGGSSTQIVFLPRGKKGPEEEDDKEVVSSSSEIETGSNTISNIDDFFVHSYLSYGVDQIRERLWDMWVKEDGNPPSSPINNPCGFNGWEVEWNGRLLVGTGESEVCSKELLKLLMSDATIPTYSAHHENHKPPKTTTKPPPRTLNIAGIQHPKIHGKFYGMSLFFFALDCVRTMSSKSNVHKHYVESWPNPSMNSLFDAVSHFCGRDWKDDLEPIHAKAHKFTRADGFPHRCLEATYVATLLRDGYGFHGDSRDVTFVLDVAGNEVEWTMGRVLYDYNKK